MTKTSRNVPPFFVGVAFAGLVFGCSAGPMAVDARDVNLRDAVASKAEDAELLVTSSARAMAAPTEPETSPKLGDELTTGRRDEHDLSPVRAPWPVPVLSIGHTIASFQYYGGDRYFHHGLDIRTEAGNLVTASVGGRVVNIENYQPGDDSYWEIAILDDSGLLWQYHHVDHNTIEPAVYDAYRDGTTVPAGARLATVVTWPIVSFGERYDHIHLNVLGPGAVYLNPFDFLEPLADVQAPALLDVGILKDGGVWAGGAVSGDYTIFAQVQDLVLHDKFLVPPRSLTYRVDGGEPVTTWDFASLPGGASNTDFVDEFYVPSMTCGDYVCRRMAVDLGFLAGSGSHWFAKTAGEHEIEITARDDAGNVATKTFRWSVL